MESGKSVVEDIRYEEGQQNLSEAQMNAIAQEAINEVKNEGKQQEDEWHNPGEEQGDELKKEEEEKARAQADADAKAKEAIDLKKKEESEKQSKETQQQTDARLKAEKETADKKTSEQGDDQPFKIADELRGKAIEELALKESLTLKEAEEQIAKDEATINKYKKDPVEMAKALRHTQREMDKAKAELEATRKAAGKPPAPVLNNVRDYVNSQLEPIKTDLIKGYKKEYPELVEGQTDDFVYGLIKKDAMERTTKILEENESKIVSAAKEKRAELIMALSDQDKSFLPDIKAALDRTSSRQLLDKSFDVNELIYWAKGRQVDRLIKEAEERGFKRGQEGSKILGEKLPGGKNIQTGGGTKKTAEARLTDTQKERARNMFDGATGMSEEDMFQAYVETYPEEFKK